MPKRDQSLLRIRLARMDCPLGRCACRSDHLLEVLSIDDLVLPVGVLLLGLVLQDGMPQDPHAHVHALYLGEDCLVGVLYLDHRRGVSHRP